MTNQQSLLFIQLGMTQKLNLIFLFLIIPPRVSPDIILKSIKLNSSDNDVVEVTHLKWTEKNFNFTLNFKIPIKNPTVL